jgi:hypothetical protein
MFLAEMIGFPLACKELDSKPHNLRYPRLYPWRFW